MLPNRLMVTRFTYALSRPLGVCVYIWFRQQHTRVRPRSILIMLYVRARTSLVPPFLP